MYLLVFGGWQLQQSQRWSIGELHYFFPGIIFGGHCLHRAMKHDNAFGVGVDLLGVQDDGSYLAGVSVF